MSPPAKLIAKPIAKTRAKSTAKPLTAPQKALRKLGLNRPIDLALHLPLRYEDETQIVRLADTREGEVAQIEATVTSCEVAYKPRRQLLVVVDDGSDTCTLRFFNFYPSQQKALAVGNRLRLRGEVRGGFMGRTMMHPSFHAAGGELPDALTPVYPTSAGLPQSYLRKAVHSGVLQAARQGEFVETIPPGLAPPSIAQSTQQSAAKIQQSVTKTRQSTTSTWGLEQSLHFLHHPTPDVSLAQLEDRTHPAWQRLKAEELLAQQLSQLQSKRERARLRAPALGLRTNGLHEQLLGVLPFGLTHAQRRVVEEIARDIQTAIPMHRLLQGDVGSGKTVVAALAAAIAIDNGWQCALMAPTEILAEQHFRKLIGWLEPLLTPLGKRVAWLTGSQKKKERTEMLEGIASGEAALVVGTHAVIQEQVHFKNLALAIIDEQHRFGVAQRLALREKMHSSSPAATNAEVFGTQEPHMLMMSATPIPRTLAMSYYADLDVSTIDELPPGRTPVITKLIAESRRDELIARIRQQLEEGRQVYWVCPLIEESEALDLTNATETHALLTEALNPPGGKPVMVGLLHSRMPPAEKKAVMALFVGGTMGVLVSTTVIEVGVDVQCAARGGHGHQDTGVSVRGRAEPYPEAALTDVEHGKDPQDQQHRAQVDQLLAWRACHLEHAGLDLVEAAELHHQRRRVEIAVGSCRKRG